MEESFWIEAKKESTETKTPQQVWRMSRQIILIVGVSIKQLELEYRS